MFPPAVRWSLVLLSLALGAAALPARPGGAILAFGAAALLAWGHSRYGTVWLAFGALRRGDGAAARRHLSSVRHPDRLEPQSRAYYEWIRGALAREDGNLPAACAHLRAALDGALRTENDRAAASCALAEALADAGRRDEAAEALARARALPHRGALDPEIARVEARVAALSAG